MEWSGNQIPFVYWTFNHLKTGLMLTIFKGFRCSNVRYSDPHCILMPGNIECEINFWVEIDQTLLLS